MTFLYRGFRTVVIAVLLCQCTITNAVKAQSREDKSAESELDLYNKLYDKLQRTKSIDDFDEILSKLQYINGNKFLQIVSNSIYMCHIDKNVVYKNYPRSTGLIVTLCNKSVIVWLLFDDATSKFIRDLSGARAKKTVNDYALRPQGDIK